MKQPSEKYRVIVQRSVKHVVGQLISGSGKTVATVSDIKLGKMTKSQKAKQVGVLLAEKIARLKVAKVVFDRGQYRYHGRVQALAAGLREGGVKI